MDGQGRSPDWNQMRALLATVEAGSLSAGARRLGLTQPTLGRQIAALEAALGVTLFERAGRALVLTETGQRLVDNVRQMGEAADRLVLAASGQSQSVEGKVRLTATDTYAAYILPPMLERLRVLAPGLAIEVIATDEIANLVRRDADIAIRHGRPTQDGLIARRCPDTLVRFYAAPRYLAEHGRRVDEAGFDGAELIGFAGRNHEVIAELRRRGVTVEEEQFRFHTNGGTVAWEWVRRGLAIGLMMESVGRMTPDVVPLLPRMEPLPVPVWLVTHRELHTSRRIRLVFDLLAESLGG